MIKDELIAKLQEIANRETDDPEQGHIDADDALLEYIDDVQVRELFYYEIKKWYA